MKLLLIMLTPLCLASCISFDAHQKKPQLISQIHRITTIDTIIPILKNLDERDLVAWDVVSVILTSKEPIHRPRARRTRSLVYEYIKEKYGSEQLAFARALALQHTIWELVDTQIPAIVQDLQHRHVKTIALTGVKKNGYGRDPHEERVGMLQKAGVKFYWPTPLARQIWEYNTGYLDGVVRTGTQAKGIVLEKFLTTAKFIPRIVVFIDDKITHLETVRDSCLRLGVEKFYGFQLDAEIFTHDIIPDPTKFQHAMEWAVEHKEWPKDL